MLTKLIPSPKTLCSGKGTFMCLNGLRSTTEGFEDAIFAFAFEGWCFEIEETLGFPVGEGVSGKPLHLKQEALAFSKSPEAYALVVNEEGVTLRACEAVGAYRGLQTLRQWLMLSGGKLAHGQIEDFPDFPMRAYMLDVSRCKIPQLVEFFRLVDLLALLKYNQLQLYVEHTFAWEGHESVWAMSSPLTEEDIAELKAYCAERYIELVPNINCLGHYERWIRHGEYHNLADHPEPYMHPFGFPLSNGTTLKPNEPSQAFVGELMDAYFPLHEARIAHIGGDEPWDLGLGWSRQLCEKKGKHAVYLDHIRAISERALKHVDQVLLWADVLFEHPESAASLPDGVVPVIWGYEPDAPYAEQCALLRKLGKEFWVAPSVRGYRSVLGNATKWGNLPLAAREGLGHGATGYLVTDWGDLGHHQPPFVSWPGLLWGGVLAWNVQAHQEEPDLALWINTFIANDPKGGTGRAVVELARVRECFGDNDPVTHPLHRFLFQPLERIKQGTPICSDELDATEKRLLEVRELCASAQAKTDDGMFVEKDLALACELGEIAVLRARYCLNPTQGLAVEIRKRLAQAIALYDALWLARNRIGGLHESSGLLREVFDSLNPSSSIE